MYKTNRSIFECRYINVLMTLTCLICMPLSLIIQDIYLNICIYFHSLSFYYQGLTGIIIYIIVIFIHLKGLLYFTKNTIKGNQEYYLFLIVLDLLVMFYLMSFQNIFRASSWSLFIERNCFVWIA